MKMLKKGIALIVSLVMALGMTVNAFAKVDSVTYSGEGKENYTDSNSYAGLSEAVTGVATFMNSGAGVGYTSADISISGTETLDSTLTLDTDIDNDGTSDYSLTISGTDDAEGNNAVIEAASTDDTKTVDQETGLNRNDSGTFSGGNVLNIAGGSNVTLTDVTVDANGEARVIYMNPGSELTLDGGTIITEGNGGSNGGGIYDNKGTLTMRDNATVSNNYNSGNGGGVENYKGNFIMSGNSVVRDNTSGNCGGGVYDGKENASFTMEDNALVTGNTASRYGGGVFVSDESSSFVMSGMAVISDNEATYGGGAGNYGGTFTMNDYAVIRGNSANSQRGGVYNDSGTFTMNDYAAISENTAVNGIAGVGNGGSFTMNDNSSVTGNTTTSPAGGVYNKGTFTMNGGSISGNSSSNGSGLYNINNSGIATAELRGGSIADNIETSEGGTDIVLKKGTVITIASGIYSDDVSDYLADEYVQLTRETAIGNLVSGQVVLRTDLQREIDRIEAERLAALAAETVAPDDFIPDFDYSIDAAPVSTATAAPAAAETTIEDEGVALAAGTDPDASELTLADAVALAVSYGVIAAPAETSAEGTAEGAVEEPADAASVSREEFILTLYKIAEDSGYAVDARADITAFLDEADVSKSCYEAIQWAVANGIIGGSEGKLLALGTLTQEQLDLIMARFAAFVAANAEA